MPCLQRLPGPAESAACQKAGIPGCWLASILLPCLETSSLRESCGHLLPQALFELLPRRILSRFGSSCFQQTRGFCQKIAGFFPRVLSFWSCFPSDVAPLPLHLSIRSVDVPWAHLIGIQECPAVAAPCVFVRHSDLHHPLRPAGTATQRSHDHTCATLEPGPSTTVHLHYPLPCRRCCPK